MPRIPRPILHRADLHALEAQHAAQPLMERAGQAAAEVALKLLLQSPAGGKGVTLVVAGPGNNGGDALVAARWLHEEGHAVELVFFGAPAQLPTDARRALDAWRAAGGAVSQEIPQHEFALAIDGLFGVGLTRPLTGAYADCVAAINALACPVLSLDIPCGLDADTGSTLGVAVRATHTASFIALKPGLLTLDGPDHCGVVSVHDLELRLPESAGHVLCKAAFRPHLKPRPRNCHKGDFGDAAIIGGAAGMSGAALLAARAALHLGAGRVYAGLLEKLPVDFAQPELMLRPAQEALPLATACAIGPGLGQSAAALDLLREAVALDVPLVLDADAINLLAAHPVLLKNFARRTAPGVLTPHPAEAARLLNETTAQVQADRVAAALKLAQRSQAVVVLKGCGSVLAAPDGRWWIEAGGNAGLASAGSGDVLTGMVAALLAQGWPALAALQAAVHLHAAAADLLAAQQTGPAGLAASELIPAARAIFNGWLRE